MVVALFSLRTDVNMLKSYLFFQFILCCAQRPYYWPFSPLAMEVFCAFVPVLFAKFTFTAFYHSAILWDMLLKSDAEKLLWVGPEHRQHRSD